MKPAVLSETHQRRDSISPGIPPTLTGTEADLEGQIRELKRQIFDLHTLFEVARQFHEVWDVDSLMDGILLVAIEHMRVGAAAIVATGSDDPSRLTRQRSKGWDLSTEPDWSVSIESPWAKRLAQYRRPLPIEALAFGPSDTGGQIEALRRAGCVLVAPMVRHDRLRGVVYLAEKVDKSGCTSGDFEFLDLLIDQFAVSLDNAQLSERERRVNEQLLTTRQRLAVAEKLAALGQMAATIAHEVRNPSGIIRNYLNLIRPALKGHEPEIHHLDIIDEELGRIEVFVRNLLGAFHPDKLQPLTLPLAPQIEEITSFLQQRLAQHKIQIISQLDRSTPSVHAEPEALRHVLINILLNAVDAMPDGGTVTFTASPDLDRVHLSITDSGPGVPPELLDRLLDPFVTTKPEGRGSGLGLSICKSLLERFDAQIGVKNLTYPLHGAVFTIHLRRADSPARTQIGGPSAKASG